MGCHHLQGPPAHQNFDSARLQFKKSQNSSAVGDTTPTQNSWLSGCQMSSIGGEAQAFVPLTSTSRVFDF